jgi:predicted acylesterase/phospholipase RssA
MLPRIICGSSAGAIIASFLCTRNDTDLEGALNLRGINYNFFGEAPNDHSGFKSTLVHVLGKLLRAIYTGIHPQQLFICAPKGRYLRNKFS